MTESITVPGALRRVEAYDVLFDQNALSRALTRLGQVTRLHAAEVARVTADHRIEVPEILEAWTSASTLLADAHEELERVRATMASRLRAVAGAVDAAARAEDMSS